MINNALEKRNYINFSIWWKLKAQSKKKQTMVQIQMTVSMRPWHSSSLFYSTLHSTLSLQSTRYNRYNVFPNNVKSIQWGTINATFEMYFFNKNIVVWPWSAPHPLNVRLFVCTCCGRNTMKGRIPRKLALLVFIQISAQVMHAMSNGVKNISLFALNSRASLKC